MHAPSARLGRKGSLNILMHGVCYCSITNTRVFQPLPTILYHKFCIFNEAISCFTIKSSIEEKPCDNSVFTFILDTCTCLKVPLGQELRNKMTDVYTYERILMITSLVPVAFLLLVAFCLSDSTRERLILMIMNGVIKKKRIGQKHFFIIGGRKLPELDYKIVYREREQNENYFGFFVAACCFPLMIRHCCCKCCGNRKPYLSIGLSLLIFSVLFISVVGQIFVVVGTLQISYKCTSEPYWECFRISDTGISSHGLGDPVNCATIQKTLAQKKNYFVCYRFVFAYPDSWFNATLYTFLSVKFIRLLLHITTTVMLWITDKSCTIPNPCYQNPPVMIKYGRYIGLIGVRATTTYIYFLPLFYLAFVKIVINQNQNRISFVNSWWVVATTLLFNIYLMIIPWWKINKGDKIDLIDEVSVRTWRD